MRNLKPILHSIGAVIAGYVVSAVLTAATIGLLVVIFPASYSAANLGWVVLNVVYGCVFAVAGGYVTAWLAPRRPVQHALALGLIMAALSALMAVAIATMPAGPAYEAQPAWYYPVLAITVLPRCG
jgi:hypothetical protein